MISLVPAWAHHYDEFWDAIRRRNLWFIKLRYGAVAMLLFFLLTSEFFLGFTFTRTQIVALFAVNAAILVYNIVLHRVRRYLKCTPGQFNPLHFSLLQMVLDLSALLILVYFTGGIETPLFMLFVFHMIIGSLILPGVVIYPLAFVVVVLFYSMVALEYLGIIPHHAINGMLRFSLYNNYEFILSYVTVFGFVMIMIVFLANNIANQLYKMEQRLVESLDKLHAAEVEKQKYIMGVVHEIKSPLTAVHSYLDVVLEDFLGPINDKIRERLMRTRSRSEEAIQMINDVLKISKLRLLDEISFDEVKIGEIITSIIRKNSAAISSKQISLKFEDRRDDRLPLKGDPVLLELAFSNLIGNAVKYVGHNGKVSVILETIPKGVQVEICDNGIGIPPKDLDKIFKDFYRASNIKQSGYEGSGLGLSIVKQIIERHGGNVKVESPSKFGSEDKPGSSFIISLPVEEIA